MAAETGATGARSCLQPQHVTWLTPQRLRAATITLFVGVFGFSSITLTGSTPAAHHHSPPPALHIPLGTGPLRNLTAGRRDASFRR